jgi:quinol monooxygenase YgiN/mannose-6-phosphate isomerase-like protein (cupin superfamily)
MSAAGRYVKFRAQEGQGDALAQRLLEVAQGLEDTPGCELYVVNRAPAEPDTVWVTEIWRSQTDADAALQSDEAKAQVAEVMPMLAGPPERIDVEPLGGTGLSRGGAGFTHVNLGEVEDQAPKYGYGEFGEARFARGALGSARTGVSFQRLRPGVRQAFGHRHHRAEEILLVVEGSGRIRIDDELIELRPLDAIRIAPESTRRLEAGPDGLGFVAVGVHHAGDAELVRDFWQA